MRSAISPIIADLLGIETTVVLKPLPCSSTTQYPPEVRLMSAAGPKLLTFCLGYLSGMLQLAHRFRFATPQQPKGIGELVVVDPTPPAACASFVLHHVSTPKAKNWCPDLQPAATSSQYSSKSRSQLLHGSLLLVITWAHSHFEAFRCSPGAKSLRTKFLCTIHSKTIQRYLQRSVGLGVVFHHLLRSATASLHMLHPPQTDQDLL